MKEATYINAEFSIKPLNLEDIRKATDLLKANNLKEPFPLEVQHNGCGKFFESIAKNGISDEVSRGAVAELYGMRVIERDDIPPGQIRMVDKDGNLIKVFNFNPHA